MQLRKTGNMTDTHTHTQRLHCNTAQYTAISALDAVSKTKRIFITALSIASVWQENLHDATSLKLTLFLQQICNFWSIQQRNKAPLDFFSVVSTTQSLYRLHFVATRLLSGLAATDTSLAGHNKVPWCSYHLPLRVGQYYYYYHR